MILEYSISVFVMQVIFVSSRTWNVRAIARNNIVGAMISGTFVHLSWVCSTGMSTWSAHKLMQEFDWSYVLIIFCSLTGGLLGTYISMKKYK